VFFLFVVLFRCLEVDADGESANDAADGDGDEPSALFDVVFSSLLFTTDSIFSSALLL
jgi:hypothetical protein